MKILNYGNLAIVFILITSNILGQFYSYFLGIAFIFGLFIMPIYQLSAGFIWFMTSNRDERISLYFKGVFIFFFLELCNSGFHKIGNQKISEQISTILFPTIPIILAIYFTYILNQYSRK